MSYLTRFDQKPSIKLNSPLQLADSTSEFRWRDIRALNINYRNGDIKMFGELQVISFNTSLPSYISDVLVKELAEAGKREKVIDNFVNFLLGILKFNEYPFKLKLKADCYFQVDDKVVTSETNFSIWKNKLYVIVNEDKHIHNVSNHTGWGECQIAGELLASAYINHREIAERYAVQTIFAIRVIGTRFTFYRAEVKSSYLNSLSEGFSDKNLSIYRYPALNDKYPNRIPCLDYTDPNQREQILEIMIKIKNFVIQNKTIRYN
ncbi:hypothetical protein Glove_471g5 [Diversispora epigaea]|uniref:Fungal-type protein kinase domain-containing protein n=1 Tax=Diversispora epigaea TaxID=1348612 RepID=A0A397GL48_9GLOM|nr:hypothetical protein Glove_471g5 [Diversispora epigaea]